MSIRDKQELIDFYIESNIFSQETLYNLIYNLLF